jgi:hypothetical protein
MIVFSPNTIIKAADVNANFTESTAIASQVNPYKFSAYMGSTQSTVATTHTKLQMNTEEYDTNSNYSTSTYGYTAPVTGYYFFSVMVQLLAQAGAVFIVGFSKDGTTEFLRGQEIPNTTGNIVLSATHLIKLTAGEILYPIYYSGSASKTLNSGIVLSKFSGILVSV